MLICVIVVRSNHLFTFVRECCTSVNKYAEILKYSKLINSGGQDKMGNAFLIYTNWELCNGCEEITCVFFQ